MNDATEDHSPASPLSRRGLGTGDIRLLAIPGSLRRNSYNKALLQAGARLAPDGISLLVYDELDVIPLFNEDAANGAGPPGVARLRHALSRSDGLLIATPEFNQAVPGVVKNMIDWLSLGEHHEGLAGMPVAVTGITTGPWGTRLAQTMLRQMLLSTQAIVMPQPNLYLRDAESLFDETGTLIHDDTRRRLTELVGALGEWVRLLTGQPAPSDRNHLCPTVEASSLVKA